MVMDKGRIIADVPLLTVPTAISCCRWPCRNWMPPASAFAVRPEYLRYLVPSNLARDSWNVLTRELKPVVRDPFSLIFSLLQPLVFLGLFAPLAVLGRAADADLPTADPLRDAAAPR